MLVFKQRHREDAHSRVEGWTLDQRAVCGGTTDKPAIRRGRSEAKQQSQCCSLWWNRGQRTMFQLTRVCAYICPCVYSCRLNHHRESLFAVCASIRQGERNRQSLPTNYHMPHIQAVWAARPTESRAASVCVQGRSLELCTLNKLLKHSKTHKTQLML